MFTKLTSRASRKRAIGDVVCRWGLTLAVLASGCVTREDQLSYPFHDEPVSYYKEIAQDIAHPAIAFDTPDEIAFSQAPRTVLSRDVSEPWDMPLMEAMQLALEDNDIIRSAGQFLTPGNSLMQGGEFVPSIYDPAVNESGVLFGNRGIEAALSAFDTNFTTNMVWGRNETVQNSPFGGGGLMPGGTLASETGNFSSSLRKDFAYGGQVQLNHTVNYLGSNVPGQLFPSNYAGLVQALYRQPLWAGAGTEYTRIAGPITQQFGGLSGVTQGVVIARINNDTSLADLQAAIRNLVKDVEDTYWDLYLTYRNYDTAVTARNAALATWRFAKIRVELGGDIDVADESQARDQYFAAQALVENTRSSIYTTETRFRRLLGLPVNEGLVIRPVDEPVTAELIPDWQVALTEALMHRVELRKQKWQIKSLDLQLAAAHSLTKPRLDFVGGYQVNGFGDKLFAGEDNDVAGTQQGLNSYYESVTQGNQTGWNLGFEFNMPIGFRSAHAQVRNIELRLAKAHRVLHAQELEIAHELAVAFQELARAYTTSQANYNRRQAAIDNVATIEKQVRGEVKTVDEILRAQDRRSRAEIDFFTSIVEYNKALTNYQYRKGTLMQDTNITLLEDGWNPDAYVDSYRRAQARSAAINASHKHSEPAEFVSGTPVGGVAFANPIPPTLEMDWADEFCPSPVEGIETSDGDEPLDDADDDADEPEDSSADEKPDTPTESEKTPEPSDTPVGPQLDSLTSQSAFKRRPAPAASIDPQRMGRVIRQQESPVARQPVARKKAPLVAGREESPFWDLNPTTSQQTSAEPTDPFESHVSPIGFWSSVD